eukprot:739324-Rhodomonas_salina.1
MLEGAKREREKTMGVAGYCPSYCPTHFLPNVLRTFCLLSYAYTAYRPTHFLPNVLHMHCLSSYASLSIVLRVSAHVFARPTQSPPIVLRVPYAMPGTVAVLTSTR